MNGNGWVKWALQAFLALALFGAGIGSSQFLSGAKFQGATEADTQAIKERIVMLENYRVAHEAEVKEILGALREQRTILNRIEKAIQ